MGGTTSSVELPESRLSSTRVPIDRRAAEPGVARRRNKRLVRKAQREARQEAKRNHKEQIKMNREQR